MKIAVTAASGQLGRAAVAALLELNDGNEVIGLARSPEKAADLGIDVRAGDYDAPDQLRAALDGVDAVLLVSGMAPPAEREAQHRNVITSAKEAGVRKIVFTSVQGSVEGVSGAMVASMLQTEADIKESGLDWAIGRNGLYIEPDVEYIDTYAKAGEITNCAGDGRCAYTTRGELGAAYARLLTDDALKGGTYNLSGVPISQAELASYLGSAFGVELSFRDVAVDDYIAERSNELGPFMGKIIAGIYSGIRDGVMDNPSDFAAVTGRLHQSWEAYFQVLSDARRSGA
ncbi:MAG: SDR family oxidoreductase [Pseudomonadota bacterium]